MEVEVAGELARFEAGLGGERVAGPGRDVGGGLRRVHRSLDHDQVAGGADAEAGPAGGLQVPAGHAGGGGGYQQGGAVPEEGQRHQVRGAVSRAGGGDPGVDVAVEPVERVELALPGAAGGRCHAGSLLICGGQTVSTTLRSSPRPVVAMITSSPARRVKSAGGTIAVPVSSTTPTGNSCARNSQATSSPGLRCRSATLTVSATTSAPSRITRRLIRSEARSGTSSGVARQGPRAQLPV